jgi:hypothetical protein
MKPDSAFLTEGRLAMPRTAERSDLPQAPGSSMDSPLVDVPKAFQRGKIEHIVILIHQHDGYEDATYILKGVAEHWKEKGIRVTVVRGVGTYVAADAAVLHVDLTVVPPEYLEYMRQYPIALNGSVADISKRRISGHLVRRGDGYDGSVIVKTNCNYGGQREEDLPKSMAFPARCFRAVRRRLPWTFQSKLGVWDYPIYQSPSQVPWAVWFNPDLIVERFLPERQDGFYCLRSWIFLGDAERNVIMYANQPIIKSRVAVRIEPAEVPEELRIIRRELGFDFGKFDYGMIDGRVVLYDANRTPSLGDSKAFDAVLKNLADGLHVFA